MKKSGNQPAKKNVNWRAEDWVTAKLPVETINEIKEAFDLFDTDQGGSIDTKGMHNIKKCRTQGCHDLIRF